MVGDEMMVMTIITTRVRAPECARVKGTHWWERQEEEEEEEEELIRNRKPVRRVSQEKKGARGLLFQAAASV